MDTLLRDLTLVRVRVTHAQDRGEDVPSSIIAESDSHRVGGVNVERAQRSEHERR